MEKDELRDNKDILFDAVRGIQYGKENEYSINPNRKNWADVAANYKRFLNILCKHHNYRFV